MGNVWHASFIVMFYLNVISNNVIISVDDDKLISAHLNCKFKEHVDFDVIPVAELRCLSIWTSACTAIRRSEPRQFGLIIIPLAPQLIDHPQLVFLQFFSSDYFTLSLIVVMRSK